MSNTEAVRRDAASRVAHMLVDPVGRTILDNAGWTSGTTITIVLETDTVGEMYKRVVSTDSAPPAVIAVPRDGMITVLTLARSEAEVDDEHSIGDTSPVGMLLDYLATRPGQALTFELAWVHATVNRADETDSSGDPIGV